MKRRVIAFFTVALFLGGAGGLEAMRQAEVGGGYELNRGEGEKVSPEVAEQGERALLEGAWAHLEAANTRLIPPARWGEEGKKALRDWAERERVRLLGVADQARLFVERYGGDRRATRAMVREFEALSSLGRLGPEANERLERVSGELLQRRDLPRKERYGIRLQQVLRGAKNREELEAGGRELLKEFGDGEAYDVLILAASGAEPSRGKALCEEILRSGAASEVKERARGVLARFKAEGLPFDFHFKGLDGREVDSKALRGKVVLIEFWATWCGPCVQGLPELRAVYDKWHRFGLEVVGVSLDSDEAQLKRFLKEHKVPWPIFFDGQGWNNAMAAHYGVTAIPMVWLVDKQGVLRSANVRGNLQETVGELLQEGMTEEERVAAGFAPVKGGAVPELREEVPPVEVAGVGEPKPATALVSPAPLPEPEPVPEPGLEEAEEVTPSPVAERGREVVEPEVKEGVEEGEGQSVRPGPSPAVAAVAGAERRGERSSSQGRPTTKVAAAQKRDVGRSGKRRVRQRVEKKPAATSLRKRERDDRRGRAGHPPQRQRKRSKFPPWFW